jgi:hypothetical protein
MIQTVPEISAQSLVTDSTTNQTDQTLDNHFATTRTLFGTEIDLIEQTSENLSAVTMNPVSHDQTDASASMSIHQAD